MCRPGLVRIALLGTFQRRSGVCQPTVSGHRPLERPSIAIDAEGVVESQDYTADLIVQGWFVGGGVARRTWGDRRWRTGSDWRGRRD